MRATMNVSDIASWVRELMDAEYERGYNEGYSAGSNVGEDAIDTLKTINEHKIRGAYDSGYKAGQDSVAMAVADAVRDIASSR